MPLIGEMRFLERIQFFNGQRLFASDLQGLEEFNREMRWLHNQSLHQPGVGSGYAVDGKKGDRQVTVDAGYAIDALGREIVLTEPQTEQVPPVADDGFGKAVFYDLTVSYPDDRDLKESETREGICLPRGAVRLREQPVFCWVRLSPEPDLQPLDDTLKAQVQSGLKIRLARAEVLNCQLNKPLSTAQRRNARPAQQPYVACGFAAGNWDMSVNNLGYLVQVDVDTKPAGFRTTPCYWASVIGERHLTPPDSPVDRVVDGFVSISNPTATGFRLQVLIPQALVGLLDTTGVERLLQALRKLWSVEWIGVEG